MFPNVYEVEHIDNKIIGEVVGVTKLSMPHLTNYSYAGSIFYCRSKGDDGKVLIERYYSWLQDEGYT